MRISFGTDGWRGIIADTFTFANVRAASQGLADYLLGEGSLPRTVAVGFDRRFFSKDFAREASLVLAANGIKVLFAEQFLPTPVLSWCARNTEGLAGAVVITASHNPFCYNGFKFKEKMGCSALPETTSKIEKLIADNMDRGKPPSVHPSFEAAVAEGKIVPFDPMNGYTKSLEALVSRPSIRRFRGKVVIDPMHGAASGHLARVLKHFGVKAVEINAGEDPLFGGKNPEPIELFLKDTLEYAEKHRPKLILALDGDGDRIGAIDERGSFFGPQEIYSLLAWMEIRNSKEKFKIAKTVSTTHTIDRLAGKYGFGLVETPIGFKHIAKKMLDGEVYLGGEESGGIGFAKHIPERDAILCSLKLIEAMAIHKKGIRAIYDDLCAEVGESFYRRRDYEISPAARDRIECGLRSSPPSTIGGIKVSQIRTQDGFKFMLEDDSWVLVRISGTEAVLRIYAEASSAARAERLIKGARGSLDF